MKPVRLTFSVATLAMVLGGCAWVEPTEQGALVKVLTEAQAMQCEHVKDLTVTGVKKVGFIERSEEKVASELQTQARNRAAELGGNAIVATSQPSYDTQSFKVLRCAP